MSRTGTKSDILRIISTEDGLHLKDSILWFDATRSGSLSFLSEPVESLKSIDPQIITTEETSKTLETLRKKLRPLICQYNRPFSIGRLKMELLPSGHALGGASLYVENGKQSVLYAPRVQTQKISVHRGFQLKKAKFLILSTCGSEPGLPSKNRNREKELLFGKLGDYIERNQWPFIFCQSLGLAQELTQYLSKMNVPVAVHPHIYKINKVYESYGCDLGIYSYFSSRRTKNKVVLCPLHTARKSPQLTDSGRPVFTIRHNDEPLPEYLSASKICEDFQLYSMSYGQDFQEIIDQVKPKEVLFFGQHASIYAEHYQKSTGLSVRALYPNDQPTLF